MANFSHEINEFIDCININDFLNLLPNKQINLLCIHLNIRSIIKNFTSLEQCIMSASKSVDVIILTEVNISDKISNLYSINGYRMFTALRKSRKGGGLILYVNQKHKCKTINIKTKHFESIMCNVTTDSNYSATLLAVYRPPNSSKNLFINELRDAITNNCKTNELYLLGDVNIDIKIDNPIKHIYSNTLHSLGLLCGITEHTRIEMRNGKLSKSCIDHIYTRSSTQDLYTAAIGTTLADHRAIVLACIGVRIQAVPKYKLCLNNQKVLENLSSIDWKPISTSTCPITIFDYIHSKFTECYKKCTEKIKIKSNIMRINNTWISKNIIKACNRRDELFIQWIKNTNNFIIKQKYNKARNYANKIIRKSKNHNIKQDIISNKSNTNKLWQILNEITGRIKLSVDEVIRNAFETEIDSCKNIADNFAMTFKNDIKKIKSNCSKLLLNKSSYISEANVTMRYEPASPKSIGRIITSMNTKKSPGIDKIRAMDIKLICHKIKSIISNLINASILTGKYPHMLKTGIVRPIHKKGSRENYANYRPITILPIINKIAEKYISQQIYKFYAANNIITPNQYGFQPHKSTTQLLSSFTDSIYKHLDNKEHVLVVFIDYTKAFDTLRHDRLLQSLCDSGIRGKLLAWCENYLCNRNHTVRVGNGDSCMIKSTVGTAQGSVLGPLHYITYVNSLANAIKRSEMYQFADDTCLIAAGRNITNALRQLQEDFDILTKWSHDAGLLLNADKTKLMYICSSQNRSLFKPVLILHNHKCLHRNTKAVTCDCTEIELVGNHTYLGMVIDSNLNWKMHINHVCDKLRGILAKFHLVKHKVPYKTLLLLYMALAESIISYGLSSYGRTYKTHLDQIYYLQLRILKEVIPYNIKKSFSNNEKFFEFCKILPIHEKTELTLLSEHFFNENLKHYKNMNSTKITTRSMVNLKLILPNYCNMYGKRSLQYIIPKLINQLPLSVRNTITHKNIKHILKRHYQEVLTMKVK